MTLLAALSVVQATVGVAQMFGRDRDDGGLQRAQMEMLRAIQEGIQAVGEGIKALLENVDELRQLILDLPNETVEQIRTSDILAAQNSFKNWIKSYTEMFEEHGVEYAVKYSDYEKLEHQIYYPVQTAASVLTGESDYSRIPVISIAALIELVSAVHLTENISDPDLVKVRMNERADEIQKYVEWFEHVLDDDSAKGLNAAMVSVRKQRSDGGYLSEGQDVSDDYFIEIFETFGGQQFNPETHDCPCGFVRHDTNYIENKGVRFRFHPLRVSRERRLPGELVKIEGGMELVTAFKEMSESGHLKGEDAPWQIVRNIDRNGIATIVTACLEGLKAALPFGGPAIASDQKPWLGTFDYETVRNKWAIADTGETKLSVETGLQLVALGGLRKMAQDSLDWLKSLPSPETLSFEVES